jgi:GH15 family glucan-1,4-alpha-glucosidase
MSRHIVLGNGTILVSLDANAQVRDFYFPEVGSENNVDVNRPHKIGVFTEGQMSWIDSGGWNFSVNYMKETMASDISASNKNLDIELGFVDAVYNEKNIFLRKITVRNMRKREREIKIMFNQQFQPMESGRGHTAFYDPATGSVIHYKDKKFFLVSGEMSGKPIDDYGVGLMGIEGKEGTWRDAEDGILSKNAIEHGSVDSTISFSLRLSGDEMKEVNYWTAAGETLEEVKELHDYILKKTPEHILESTQDFWRAWVNKTPLDFLDLGREAVDLYKKSLLIIRTHADNRGGIIASSDGEILQYGRDNYSYVWPRDASFTVMALDKAGYTSVTKKFFEFCNDTISEEGYFYHKYLPDKSLGSSWHPWMKDGQGQLPIQEDETALVLVAFWKHYESTKDIEFIESLYNSLIKKAADFLCDYRDMATGLPKPSYDLWEQKYGVSTFTASSVAAALDAAANFAKTLGKEEDERKYFLASRQVKDAVVDNLYNKEKKFFDKFVLPKNGGMERDTVLDASSAFGVFYFKIIESSDPRISEIFHTVEEKLRCKNGVDGVARYEGDEYYRAVENAPGNPWFITTLWLARYYAITAKSASDLERVKTWINWSVDKAFKSGILSEQVHAVTGKPLSAAPLVWSHAEYVSTVLDYLEKKKELANKKCE